MAGVNFHRRKFPVGSRLRIGIVASEYHSEIMKRLLNGALDVLAKCKVKKGNIRVMRIPGSFEVPLGCLMLLKKNKLDALVALGCIVKGETDHHFHMASAVSKGIMDLSLTRGVPIGFGIITANTHAQAEARSKGEMNRGRDAALAAVRMALLA